VKTAPRWIDRLPEFPALALDVLDQVKAGRLEVINNDTKLDEIRQEIAAIHRRLVLAVTGVGLLVGAAVLHGVSTESAKMVGPLPLGVWLLGGTGLVAVAAAFRNKRPG
jgi:hypothetical protein